MRTPFAAKTRLAFLPMLYLSFCFLAGYLFFYWLFYVRLKYSISEDLIQLWLPMGLSCLLVFVIIRPRIHLLKLDKDNGKIRGLYYMVGAAVLFLPMTFGVHLLETAMGKLTILQSTRELPTMPETKYYQFKTYYPDKKHYGLSRSTTYSGKHNQYLNYRLYFAIPLLANESDTTNAPVAYVSEKYSRQISSRLDGDKRVAAWRQFWDESMQSFEKSTASFVYLERYGQNDDHRILREAAAQSGLYTPGKPFVILKPVQEPFAQRNGKKGQYLFLSLSIGLAVWFGMIQIPGLHANKAKRFRKNSGNNLTQQIQFAWNSIRPQPGYAATPVLMVANMLVFLFMVFAGLGVMGFYTKDLVTWGASYEPYIAKGQWWRLFTHQYLHGGLAHLTMNMVGLYLAGILLEPIIGTRRFLAGYLIAGMAAGLVSLWWHHQPVVSVGASGAIFGLYGILLAMILFTEFDAITRRSLLILLACTAGVALVMGFATSGIDNSAHLGGLIAGFCIGFYFAKSERTDTDNEEFVVKKKAVTNGRF